MLCRLGSAFGALSEQRCVEEAGRCAEIDKDFDCRALGEVGIMYINWRLSGNRWHIQMRSLEVNLIRGLGNKTDGREIMGVRKSSSSRKERVLLPLDPMGKTSYQNAGSKSCEERAFSKG